MLRTGSLGSEMVESGLTLLWPGVLFFFFWTQAGFGVSLLVSVSRLVLERLFVTMISVMAHVLQWQNVLIPLFKIILKVRALFS